MAIIAMIVLGLLGLSLVLIFGRRDGDGLLLWGLGCIFVALSIWFFLIADIPTGSSLALGGALVALMVYSWYLSLWRVALQRQVYGFGILIFLLVFSLVQLLESTKHCFATRVWLYAAGGLAVTILAVLVFMRWRRERQINDLWMSLFLLVIAFLVISALVIHNVPRISSWSPVSTMDRFPNLVLSVVALIGAVFATACRLGMAFEIEVSHHHSLAQRSLQESLSYMDQAECLSMISATLAHELNQPITALMTNIQLAQRYLRDLPESADLLEMIGADLDRDLVRIIDLLNAYVGGDIRIEPDQQRTDMDAAIAQVVEWLRPQLNSRQISVRMVGKAGANRVCIAQVHCTQILLNLFQNSIEALTRVAIGEGEIVVSQSYIDDYLTLNISDNGRGILPKVLLDIKADLSAQKLPGMGLGLFITRWIIERYDGRFSYWSEVNKGFCVQITLPVEV